MLSTLCSAASLGRIQKAAYVTVTANPIPVLLLGVSFHLMVLIGHA